MRRAIVGLIIVLSVGCASDRQVSKEGGPMTSPADRVAHTRSLVEAFNRHDVARSICP